MEKALIGCIIGTGISLIGYCSLLYLTYNAKSKATDKALRKLIKETSEQQKQQIESTKEKINK